MSKTQTTMPKSRLHADSMVEMLKADPAFANAYLQSALEDSHTQEGREALLIFSRCAVGKAMVLRTLAGWCLNQG